MVEILAPILSLCIEGNTLCFRSTAPVVKHYQPGKACYIEGVFYPSCPAMPLQSD